MEVRVLQLIDSLEIGGAEKMAVQLANKLSSKIECSALCSTRNDGPLKDEIEDAVRLIILNKTHVFDLNAIVRLRKFIKKHKLNIIHAHGSSFFTACLLKVSLPKTKIVWHDHNGERGSHISVYEIVLKFASILFDQAICVNLNLVSWCKKNLSVSRVTQINNFISFEHSTTHLDKQELLGSEESFKIIHVANLRHPKDHLTGLIAINILRKNKIDVSYHLFGKFSEEDEYYKKLMTYVKKNKLEKHVFFYGLKQNIHDYLKLADIGILTSTSEGLPLSLIEYALAKVPIAVTEVGECPQLVKHFAKLFQPKDYESLSKHLKDLIQNKEQARRNAELLFKKVYSEFNPDNIVEDIINIYQKL